MRNLIEHFYFYNHDEADQQKSWWQYGEYPGIEKEFDQRLMPDGKCNIDGFLCVFDVSIVPNRTLEKQVENKILNIILQLALG